MLLSEERKQVVQYLRKMLSTNLTVGTGGNISIHNIEKNLLAVSPTSMDYLEMEPADVVVTTLDGEIVEGEREITSEFSFHLALQNLREDIHAVVHSHPIYSTTIACMNWEIPSVHYLVGFSGYKVPLAKYATYGTKELADNIINAIGENNAVLIANHGLLSVGNTIQSAFTTTEQIELVAQLYYQTKSLGDPVILTKEQMDAVLAKFYPN